MANTKLVLDRQAIAKTFDFGTTTASEQGLVTIYKGTAAASTVGLDVKGSVNVGGDINLTGNLNITGAINTQTVTNTNVTDLTITVNDGGSTPSDGTAGIIVEGTGNSIIAALYYTSTSGTKWSFATGGDAVGTTASQTLTNKTLTAAVLNGTITGTSVSSTSSGSTLAIRDTNSNIGTNNFISGFTTTATAAGVTTLTVASTQIQVFTGSTTQTVSLPVTSTLTTGHQFIIENNSTGLVTVNSSGGNAVIVLAAGTSATVTCVLTSGTTAASWDSTYIGALVASGKVFTVSNTLTLTGTDGSTLNIGAGGTLGSNAYTSTAYAPLASPTFTGTVTIPTPFTLGATSVTTTGTQLNYLNAATGTTGTTSTNLVFSTSPVLVTPTLGVASATSLSTSAATPLILTNGQAVNIAVTSQTVGATTLTIPNFASVSDTFVFTTLAQTLSNKTFVAPALGTPASGVMTNVTGTATGLTSGITLALKSATTTVDVSAATAPTTGYALIATDSTHATWQPITSSTYFRSTVVSGTQDSVNKTFTIANALSSGSEQVYVNGQLLTPGSSNDYVISGTTVTFQAAFTAPASTDVIRVYGNY